MTAVGDGVGVWKIRFSGVGFLFICNESGVGDDMGSGRRNEGDRFENWRWIRTV